VVNRDGVVLGINSDAGITAALRCRAVAVATIGITVVSPVGSPTVLLETNSFLNRDLVEQVHGT